MLSLLRIACCCIPKKARHASRCSGIENIPAASALRRGVHEYDVALKSILTRPGSVLLNALTGSSSLRWLNVETPLVRNLRVDLLGETSGGGLVHLELQSRNDPGFALRMGGYCFGVALRYGSIPRQDGLYVGSEPLRMKSEVRADGWIYRFDLVDVRDLDGEALLESDNLGHNVMAVLTRLGGRGDTIRRVLKRIAASSPGKREQALAEFCIVAGL